MKVSIDMIDPQFRFRSRFIRVFLRYRNEKSLRFMGNMSQKMLGGRKSKKLNCEEVSIERKDGTYLRLLVYSAKRRMKEKNVPGVLWLHGGGYALGSATRAIPYAEKLIEAEECVVAAPDYTLSGEKPYPAALMDCYTALAWMKSHAGERGLRPNQIFVGGDSAGGGLTAALSMYARDQGEIGIAFQMLLYPMIDDRMTSDSMKDNDAPMWNEHSNRIAWKMYLGGLSGSDEVPAYAAPARAADYSRLPPAFTFVGALDPFRDETVCYAEKLNNAGIEVELYEYPGCFHAFDQASKRADKSRDAIEKMLAAYRHAVIHYFAE